MKKQIIIALISLVGLTSNRLGAQTTTPTPEENPTGNAGALKAQVETGGSYDPSAGNATRIVNDLHVPGALGVYGLDFTRYWNSTHNEISNYQFESARDFGDSGWSHSWRWKAVYEFTDPEPVMVPCGEGGNSVCESDDNRYTTSIDVTFPDGHITKYKIVRLRHAEWMVPGSYPWWGPPYTPSEMESLKDGGTGVHDHLCNMDPNGNEFWLCRADGGSVRFQYVGDDEFQATEVYDPHGLKTTLTYTDGNLTHVEQPGGRFLDIRWGQEAGAFAILQVSSGSGIGGAAVNQTVHYHYAAVDGTNGVSLQQVVYDNEPENPNDPTGPKVTAFYHYGNCWGDEPASFICSGTDASVEPLLKRADDPHFAGPMAIIRYNYRGVSCPPPTHEPWNHFNFIPAQAYAIAAEKSDNGVTVSSFSFLCDSGLRQEVTGLDNYRTFYFGTTAQTADWPFNCPKYKLGKLSDFWRLGDLTVPFEKQNYLAGAPRQIWDGRGLMTEAVTNGQDDSGEPAEIHRIDGSVDYYDRVNPGASALIDPAQGMYNPYNHWVFNETHQLNPATSHTTTYTRDPRRRIKDINYAGGTSEHFGYNDLNQITSHTLPSGAVVTYEYDSRGLLEREYNSVDGWDARREYIYDELDRVKTVSDGRSRSAGKDFSTQMTYNGRHQVITVEYAGMLNAPDNPTMRYRYDRNGNCTLITDELGHTKTYQYDLYRRCFAFTESINAETSRTWNWVYDRYFGTQGYDPSAHTSKQWRLQIEPAYDAAGNRNVTARWFDANDRIVDEYTGVIQGPGGMFNGPDIEVHHFGYDANGQKNSYTDPVGRQTTYEYDNRNRLWKTNETVNTVPRTTETLYDWAGNKTMVKFPVEAAGQRTQQWLDYDELGQAGRFVDERGSTTNLTYVWGPMKKLYTVTTYRDKDGGGTEDQRTTFSYDGMGKSIDVEFPDHTHETTTYECKNGVTYRCDQPHTWTNRKGQIKYFHYDARGREDSNSWADIEGICNPAADSGPAPCIAREWDSANRLSSITNIFSSIDFAYDNAGQLVWEGDDIAGSGGQTQTNYGRYANGNVEYVQYPDGIWVYRDYNARGQLQSVWDSFVDWQEVIAYTYFADGKVDYADYQNGVRTNLAYDGRGMLQVVEHFRRSPYQNYSWRQYYRDERDRITAFQKSDNNVVNPMENGRGDRFRYDAEGQLIEAYYNAVDPAVSGAGYWRYDGLEPYDALGNRNGWKYVSSRGWMLFGRRDNGLNQYSSWENEYPDPPLHWGSGIFYDDNSPWATYDQFPGNGVMMAEGRFVASYNALNQPKVIIGPSNWTWFGYDPLGRCVKRWNGSNGDANTNPAKYFYYEGWNLIEESQGAGSVSRNYVHGGRVDEIVKELDQYNPAARFFHYDARGHCTLQTDTNGNIAEQYEYDAFGYPYFFDANGTNIGYSPWGNRFLFTGREWLSDLKLYDFRNRLYQPELGRFMQPDPKQFAAGDYNLYRYCHNDPINRNDPFGLEFTDLGYRFSDFVQGADYGITQPMLTAPQIILTPVAGGYTASVPKFNLTVQSTIATKARDGQTVFNRTKENIGRTVKHEGDHREHNRGWYEKNENKVLRDLNSDKVYKTPGEAKSAVEQKLQKNYENFRKQEDTHTGPNWPNYKRPDREHP